MKPTHDTPEAALAAALRADWPCICTPIWTERGLSDPDCPHHDPEADAADLIVALDGWTLVPDAERAAWATLSGDLDWAKAEIERLRAALEDGIELPAIEGWSWFDWCEKARAALAPSEPERIEE